MTLNGHSLEMQRLAHVSPTNVLLFTYVRSHIMEIFLSYHPSISKVFGFTRHDSIYYYQYYGAVFSVTG